MQKGPYKTGVRDQMTDTWKELVRGRMRETGETQASLEKRIKAGKGQIAKMLSPDQNSSVWVSKVAAALRLPMPGEEDADEAALLKNYRAASPERRQALIELSAAAAGLGAKPSN